MKKERKTKRFEYSKVGSRLEYQYWGIHPTNGRLHIDTKRYKKICEDEAILDYMPEGLFINRSTPYFIPAAKKRYDHKYNIFRDLILNLKKDWQDEYKPFLAKVRTPKQVEEQSRLERIQFTVNSEDYDSINLSAFMQGVKRINKYDEIIKSLYLQFIQKVCVEINRYLLIVCQELGYDGKDFGLKDFYSFSEGLAKGLGKDTKKPIVQSLKKFHTFNRLNKINNFLKHNTITACQTLKKFYPQNVVDGGLKYKNGMYAGNWIKIDENYLDEIFDKLLNFFGEFCKNILGENIEETNWNYDDYFKNAFHKKFKYPYENEDWGFGEDF